MRPFRTSLPARTRHLLLACILLLSSASAGAEFALSDLEPGPTRGIKGPPHVARVGDRFVVVWSEVSAEDPNARWIAASVVDDNGRILRTFPPTPFRQGDPQFPARIAASPDRVAVPGLCLSPSEIRSACVTWLNLSDGSISEPQLIEESAENPSIAWNGQEFLLTYISKPNSERMVRVRVISPEGSPGQPFDLGKWYGSSHGPAVTAAGHSFYVAWHLPGAISNVTEVVGGAIRGSTLIDAPRDESATVFHLSPNVQADELIVVSSLGQVRLSRTGACHSVEGDRQPNPP